jgi:hypothetical protein
MELNASDKHHDRCRSTRLPSGWEKPLNTHTCLRTSLVWAGCVVTPRLQLWLVGLCLFALCSGYHSSHSAFHNRGRDGLVCQGGWPVTLLWRWSLFVPLAGGSPRQQVAPQATLVSGAVMAPWRRHFASTSHCTPSVGSLLCQFRSSWHTPTGGMLCLDAQQMSLAMPQGRALHTVTNGISLVGRSTALRLRSSMDTPGVVVFAFL